MSNIALKYRTGWLSFGWLMVIAVFYLSLTPHPPEIATFEYADKLKHFTAYFCLMAWFSQLYRPMMTRLAYLTGFIFMGVFIEYLQSLTQTRSFEVYDMLANSCGVAGAFIIFTLYRNNLLQRLEQRFCQTENLSANERK